MAGERLQKVLAAAGIASRRAAEKLIEAGRVEVDGVVITRLGTRVDPDFATVKVDGQVVSVAPRLSYLMLNKPADYITTRQDQGGRRTVMELLPPEWQHLYPVGRLDRDTEGLLLFTNDGKLTYRLTHPSHEVPKAYIAMVEGFLDAAKGEWLERGVELEDGLTAPAEVELLEGGRMQCRVRITIREGRNRQIRRMFAAVGCPVIYLERVAIGDLTLGDLPRGRCRLLTGAEVSYLKRAVKYPPSS